MMKLISFITFLAINQKLSLDFSLNSNNFLLLLLFLFVQNVRKYSVFSTLFSNQFYHVSAEISNSCTSTMGEI